jgi:hypothetical protein
MKFPMLTNFQTSRSNVQLFTDTSDTLPGTTSLLKNVSTLKIFSEAAHEKTRTKTSDNLAGMHIR